MAKRSASGLATSQRKRWLQQLQPDGDAAESGKPRVVIDTNVWYSAFLYGGNPERAMRLCQKQFAIVISPYLLSELLQLLKESGEPYRWRNAVETSLKRLCQVIEPAGSPVVSRDPKDDPVLATALAGKCKYLITGDLDLLSLGEYQDLLIVNPTSFLNVPEIEKLL